MKVLINDTFFMDACADTGTSRTILSYVMVKKYGLKLYTARERLFAANGERMHCEGRTPHKIDFGRKSTRILALVTSALKHEMLISLDNLKKMQILPESFPSILVRKVEQNSLEAMKELKKRRPAEICQGGREVRSEGDGVLPRGGGHRRGRVGQVRGRVPAQIRDLQAWEGDRPLHQHQKRRAKEVLPQSAERRDRHAGRGKGWRQETGNTKERLKENWKPANGNQCNFFSLHRNQLGLCYKLGGGVRVRYEE